jgi:hypothetical protein
VPVALPVPGELRGPLRRTPDSVRVALLSILFLAPRLLILFTRNPFYDELFTRWIAAKPLAGILAALRFDSGPPLYYVLVHLIGDPPLPILRAFSLLFAAATFLLILGSRRLGDARYWAAALLALYPPAVVMAVDARAYSLCAFFVALGMLALEADRPFAAALALVLAACSHYYAVLFFPLLLLRGRRGLGAAIVAGVLFLPLLWLASHQPAAAMTWNDAPPFVPFLSLSFAGRYAALLADAPIALIVTSLVVLGVAVARTWKFAPYVLLPMAAVLALLPFRRGIYFPMRFESILAVPLLLWAAVSLQRWSREARLALAAGLLVIGGVVVVRGALDHAARPIDACSNGALFVREHVPLTMPVVASGYCYLYAESLLGGRVVAFPPAQALHPGWWLPPSAGELPAAVAALPRGEFVWLGQTTPEMAALLHARRAMTAIELGHDTRLLRIAPDTLH